MQNATPITKAPALAVSDPAAATVPATLLNRR